MNPFAAASASPVPVPYCGTPPAPAELLERWNLDPLLLLALLLAAWMLARRAQWNAVAGTAVLAFAFVSPLCAASSALFSARAVHHLLLVAVAAPLFAARLPWPAAGRRASPLAALAIATACFWAWHVPAAYARALSDTAWYWVMQATLLASAVAFWRALRLEEGPGVLRVVALVLAAAQMGLLGALLTFAPQPLYAPHAVAPLAWGLTPLADQQLAGLVMWVPGMLPYAVALAWSARRLAAHGHLGAPRRDAADRA
jgi:putative membrane protein